MTDCRRMFPQQKSVFHKWQNTVIDHLRPVIGWCVQMWLLVAYIYMHIMFLCRNDRSFAFSGELCGISCVCSDCLSLQEMLIAHLWVRVHLWPWFVSLFPLAWMASLNDSLLLNIIIPAYHMYVHVQPWCPESKWDFSSLITVLLKLVLSALTLLKWH